VLHGRLQTTVRIPPDLDRRLEEAANTRRVSKSAVLELALHRYLDGALTDTALVLRRFDRIDRALQVLTRDLSIVSEALSVYIQLWMASTPEVPESEKADARRLANARFLRFTEYVATQLAAGHRLIDDLATPIADVNELKAAAVSEVQPPPTGTAS
jgi:hypothetical protein